MRKWEKWKGELGEILSELKFILLELWPEYIGDLEKENDGEGRSELEGKKMKVNWNLSFRKWELNTKVI